MSSNDVNTDLLIVGAGPAGSALACFLASHGKTGILVSAASGSASTPRAHITNMAALECLRDIGLERECMAAACSGNNMTHTRWCYSMAGEEYARIYSWGNDPMRKGHYEAASPCTHVDLPQTELEPILTRRAIHSGWVVRFNSSFTGFTRSSNDEIISEIKDDLTNQIYKIRSRYLFGCDGARSQVVRELGLPLEKRPRQGLALNVLVKAEMSHLVKSRMGNLHWVFQLDKDYPPWGWATCLRMVKPWNEWMFIFLSHPAADLTESDIGSTHESYLSRVKEVIGDETVRPEILDVSNWWINETVAEYYSDGNIFCLGDAVHRHPPFNGLGSNTCIQDAFNLAWKIAYTMSGKAGRQLLDTYNFERQPIGAGVIARANQGLKDHSGWMQAIGLLDLDLGRRKEALSQFEDLGEVGQNRRRLFQQGIEKTSAEFHGLGIEMNQLYQSTGIYDADEGGPRTEPVDPIKDLLTTTYPGSRLPHAWLNLRTPGTKISTIDLAGRGRFCLFTGPGGNDWKIAADAVSKKLGAEIRGYSIGWKQDYEDVYFDWARRREVREDGCILVRPDRFVAWRSDSLKQDCQLALEGVMKTILSLP